MIWDAAITRLGRPSAHWFSLFKLSRNPRASSEVRQLSYLASHPYTRRYNTKNTRVAAPASDSGLWEAGNPSAYTSDDEGLWYACSGSRQTMERRFGTRVVWNKAYYLSDPGPPGSQMHQAIVEKCLVVEPQDLVILTPPRRTARSNGSRSFAREWRLYRAARRVIKDCAEY